MPRRSSCCCVVVNGTVLIRPFLTHGGKMLGISTRVQKFMKFRWYRCRYGRLLVVGNDCGGWIMVNGGWFQ